MNTYGANAVLTFVACMFFGAVPMAVAKSLKDRPMDWRCGPGQSEGGWFELIHTSDARLWIANRTFGMDVNLRGFKTWGSITVLSALYLSPGHHLLRQAANRWLRDFAPAEPQRPKSQRDLAKVFRLNTP